MLKDLLADSRRDEPLWLPDLRETFSQMSDGIPLILRLSSFDGKTRDYRHTLPTWKSAEERELITKYLCATVYNAMSVCGGYDLCIYTDNSRGEVMELLEELRGKFQLEASSRSGLGKVINIANRMGRAFGKGDFVLHEKDQKEYSPLSDEIHRDSAPLQERLKSICQKANDLNCVGIDIGGTDIKLVAASRGSIIAIKEYDWNPAQFSTAEEILYPILLLIRLMRACIACGSLEGELVCALRKEATLDCMAEAVEAAENTVDCNVLDAVGVSFPDIVLRDRIIGGETPKTDGMRKNKALPYEEEFAKLGELRQAVLALCRTPGYCRIVNDGHMAAFTTAVELAYADRGEEIKDGVLAHSLGTDLGTGWLDERGEIPQFPLELYDVWVDLGSERASAYPPLDLRSIKNENSGLPGARRYLGQAATYRMAWELKPALLDGFVQEDNNVLTIRMDPEDLRKPCLEHLMRCAANGDAEAQEIFRRIGRHLAVVTRELEYLLHPQAKTRTIFGRFVKSEACFALIQEGFAESLPDIQLINGGDGLANTPLMRQLDARPDATVAQFAQAVGAVYYAFI